MENTRDPLTRSATCGKHSRSANEIRNLWKTLDQNDPSSAGSFFFVKTAEKSGCTTPEISFCAPKIIHSLKGIEQFKNLKRLNCSLNQLTSLDISKNTKIEFLDIRMNGLLKTLYVWEGFNWNNLRAKYKDEHTQIVVR